MTTERETLTAKAERWEGDESIILACGGPVGGTLSDRDAAIIVHWLNDRGALGELATRLRATPPAEGPVCWVTRDSGPSVEYVCVWSAEPEQDEDGDWTAGPDGIKLMLNDTAARLGLVLQPGECRRVRLTVEGVSDG